MKVTPVASPHQVRDLSTPEHVRTARAVEAFNKASTPTTTAQEHPVLDANNVQVEELGAIQAQTTETVDKNSEEQATEVTPAPKVEEKPKEDPRFTQLARQERALRAKAQQQEQSIKAREAALAAREAELAAKDQQYKQDYIPKSRIKQDALTALDEAGVTYDELTASAATRQPTDPRVTATISRLEAKIQELEQKAANSEKSYADQQQASYKAAVQQIARDAKALVANDPEFETIKATNSIKDVVELIEKTYQKTGEVLSVEDAAKEVEEYLVEEAMKLTQVGKIKQRMAKANASSTTSNQKTEAPPKQTQAGMKTLTNAASSTRKLSARERALLAFKGELKG